jgi:hypothetical protein
MQHELDLPNAGRSAALALTPQTSTMLIMLAEQGLSKELTACFLEMAGIQRDHLRWLHGPVVQHRSCWMDLTPPWIFQAIHAERLGLILDEHARGEIGWQVGPAELTAVMQPATMEAPLCYEYTQIFLWASAQAVARRDAKPVGDIWQALGGAPVTDDQVTRPGGAYYQDYRQLASDIRRKVVQAQQARERSPRAPRPPRASYSLDVVQGSLF